MKCQDVDNYDLGTYGKDIEIMFVFTKDKYSMVEEEPEKKKKRIKRTGRRSNEFS